MDNSGPPEIKARIKEVNIEQRQVANCSNLKF